MDKKFISELNVNEQVDSVFMLRRKTLRLTKYDKPYLQLSLTDKTGKIEGRLWEKAEEFNTAVDTGDVVHVKGMVDKYRDEKQLKVSFVEKSDDRAFQYKDMVRVADNRDKIYSDIKECLEGLKNPWIKSLAEKFTNDEKLMSLFKEGVGGKSWHNAYIGGLMEHTYEVMYIAGKICELYPESDRDIVVFGSFIHDIGKVVELDAKKLEYTIEGGLLGHIAIGYRILMEKIKDIQDFPGDLRLRIEHIVLSHHGEYEQQSPVLPKTLEATIVYQTDELVSQANAIKEIQLHQSKDGKIWSDYVSIKNRKYYIKNARDEDWNRTETPKDEKRTDSEKPSDDLFEEINGNR